MYVYKVLESAWALCTPNGVQPEAVYQSSLVMWEAQYKLFLFGGMRSVGTVSNNLYSYTVSNDTINSDQEIDGSWASISPGGTLPTARYGHTAVANEATASMLLFGGVTDFFVSLDDLWSFDFNSESWTQLSPSGTAPSARYYHATAWWPDQQKMFISGGLGLDAITFVYQNFADMFVYDAVANAWSELTPNGRGIAVPGLYAHSLVLMTDAEQFLVLGGYEGLSTTASEELYGYDIASGTWSELVKTGDIEARVDYVAMWYQGAYDTAGYLEWDDYETMLVFGGLETEASTATGEQLLFSFLPT
ncbi:unnamed protein product [Prorocentrum cordatum]|uniref:Uncharacterized protein n=1 Tax=Prorocentrum cordatum TaxID=2364126 RepID=A0ABN9UG36_9DINO|nr:unnamed protein product [Polarella glacialis]